MNHYTLRKLIHKKRRITKKKTVALTSSAIATTLALTLLPTTLLYQESDGLYVHAKAPAETILVAAPTKEVKEETTTLPPETTEEATRPAEEATTLPQSVKPSDLNPIPVEKLEISEVDLSTDAEVIHRIETNSVPDIKPPTLPVSQTAGFLYGIDVSKHQGSINWTQVKNDGIEFAFIKVAGRGYETGKLYYDTRYKENLSGATSAGIKVGAYFFSQATTVMEAREEASMMIDALKGYEITYPVVFDWETDRGYRTNTNISQSTMTAMAETFCDMLEAAGYRAMIYANTFDFERFHAREITTRYASWLARYPKTYANNSRRYMLGDGLPELKYPYQIWQYSSTGRVNGITGDVDMNISFIDFHKKQTNVPMSFETKESIYTKKGCMPQITEGLRAYNTAGVEQTASVQTSITNKNGTTVSLDTAIQKTGIYTITYTLKDFTGYTASKSIPLMVYDTPVITLQSELCSFSEDVPAEEIFSYLQNNLLTAYDSFGQNKVSEVKLQYPDFYEIIPPSEDDETGSETESDTLNPDETPTEADGTTSAPENTIPSAEEYTTTASETTVANKDASEEESTTASQWRLIPGTYTVTYSFEDSYLGTFKKTIELQICSLEETS